MTLTIGIPKEVFTNERRVAASPETVAKLIQLGFRIQVESGAGVAAEFTDTQYKAAGAAMVSHPRDLWKSADIIIKVRAPMARPDGVHELDLMRDGTTLISFVYPAQNPDLVKRLLAKRATTIAMDLIPRITRAQKMDALSSMANIAGYRAVIEAAAQFGRFFTGQITAAGKVAPAKVLIIGAGVAGLAAIGTARSLGAIVRAFDTRPATKEQVQSMGAEFLTITMDEDGSGQGGYAKEMSPAFIKAEMDLFKAQAKDVDIIITTALIPGKKAPILLEADLVACMNTGSVIIDMAAEQGGNCALTKNGEIVVSDNGVRIVGYSDLPSRLATQASQLYGTNLWHLLTHLQGASKSASPDGTITIDTQDEITRPSLVTNQGVIMWPYTPPAVSAEKKAVSPTTSSPSATGNATVAPLATVSAPLASVSRAPTTLNSTSSKASSHGHSREKSKPLWPTVVAALLILIVVGQAPASFASHFTVFVLACFVGWQLVWNVAAALHTPLMSVTNAISGIIVLGAILGLLKGTVGSSSYWLNATALLLGTINIAGGFLVTARMLKMFRK